MEKNRNGKPVIQGLAGSKKPVIQGMPAREGAQAIKGLGEEEEREIKNYYTGNGWK